MATGGTASTITLEQFVALNDEIAALVRAGIPLEQGLAALGGELPGRPGKLAEALASRMGAGESLAQILADEDARFPPVWRAVVEAGLRSGRLAAALESLSATARRVADLRRLVGAGLLYPLIVLTVAYLLFLFLILWLAPTTLVAHENLIGASDPLLAGLTWLGQTAVFWAVPLPVIVAIFGAVGWRRSGRNLWSGRRERAGVGHRRLGGGFGIRETIYNGHMATFAEILALLVKEQVPLQQSVVLAAEASGDRGIAEASREIADRLQRGEVPARREELPQGFPPLMGWLLLTGRQQLDLSDALSRSAAVYRDRAARAASLAAIYLPILITVSVGGTATLLCGLVALLPVIRMLYHLTWPLS